MAPSALPDGDGVIEKAAPAGKVIALYAALLAAGAGGTIGLLVLTGSLQPAQAHASQAGNDRGIIERLERIEQAQADAVRAATQLQLDVAVIKSQVSDLRGRR